MSYKVHEQNGVWSVNRGSENISFPGKVIHYEQYKQLRNTPHNAEKIFMRDQQGKIIVKTTQKDVK